MTTKTAPKKKSSRGRPAGSKTQTPTIVTTPASRCPKCSSTERGPYTRTNETAYNGTERATGAPYTHIVRRFCKCSSCGQARVDRTFENRTPKAA